MRSASAAIHSALEQRCKGYICVTGVHGIMEAQRDHTLLDIYREAFLVVPDGMPMVWMGRSQGLHQMDRVFGPDLMSMLLQEEIFGGRTHFLYGGAPGVAEDLSRRLRSRCPKARIVGTYTPPFRPLNPEEGSEFIQQVSSLRPDIIWVGLSTPTQEKFMAEYLSVLDTILMVGVGAAFDYQTGRIKDSPLWVKRAGLQWVHRLFQDPRRLWKRYLLNNPWFAARAIQQVLGIHKYTLPEPQMPSCNEPAA
jgi:N-acetylglucosaminyldiphosphoundecaprenol N-acetyl-beta-D-mannosaminyltransferase